RTRSASPSRAWVLGLPCELCAETCGVSTACARALAMAFVPAIAALLPAAEVLCTVRGRRERRRRGDVDRWEGRRCGGAVGGAREGRALARAWSRPRPRHRLGR